MKKKINYKGNKRMYIRDLQELAKSRGKKTLFFEFTNEQGITYEAFFMDPERGLFCIQDANARIMNVDDWCEILGEEKYKFLPITTKTEQEMFLLNRSN